MHIPDQESRGHIQKTYLYFIIGALLLGLTVLTVTASYVNWGEVLGGGFVVNILVALLIATLKAYLVIMFFMHLRYESPIVIGYGLFYPFVLFLILISFVAIDVFLRVIPVLSN